MKITFFGVRGTSPVTQPEFSRYGGETTSLLVEGKSGEKIIIDAGTGLRDLGRKVTDEPPDSALLLLMTHYHLDHVIGLPSFFPLYDKQCRITAAAPIQEGRSVQEVLSRIFDEPFWPLQVDTLPARFDFLTLSSGPLRWGELEIRWAPLHHPGGATAYRIDEPATNASFVFATDVEWNESTDAEKEAFIKLCADPAPPDLLVFDGQYSDDNYDTYRGWGHGPWQTAAAVAGAVKANRLLITHHDPANDDNYLAEIEKKLKEILPSGALARAGMEVILN